MTDNQIEPARRKKGKNKRKCIIEELPSEGKNEDVYQEPCIKFADQVQLAKSKSGTEDDPQYAKSEYCKSGNQSFDEGNKSFHSTGYKESKRKLKRADS